MTALRSIFTPTERPGLYIIAEAGVNHDGSPADAHALIDLAAAAGADAIKFQTFEPASLVSDSVRTAAYQAAKTGIGTQRELLERYVLPLAVWRELRAHATQAGIDFLSTAFDEPSLDLVCGLDVPALKLGSGELTNKPLLTEVARRGLPVICSTGMGTEAEVADAVAWLAAAPAVMLLHCVSSYPAPVDQSNLRSIATLRERFGLPVGWSDHTVGPVSAVVAVALGAAALEKHVTLDTARSGPDHAASADPATFGEYVAVVRAAHTALGDGRKQPVAAEADNAPLVRRSWHARRDLRAGGRIRADDVVLLRPATGLRPAAEVVGRALARDVGRGAALSAADLVATADVGTAG